MKSKVQRVGRITGRLLGIGLLAFPIIGMCAEGTLPVSIHGVNYSGDDFSYIVEDPLDSRNSGGGESVGPFAAGGIMCCYALPQAWSPGIKIKIYAKHWVKGEKGKGVEVAETKIVEVPPYVDGKPGEIWVIKAGDGSLSVVSSDYQPDNQKWPGLIKGWPVASVAYKRERLALAVNESQIYLNAAISSLAKLKADPASFAKKSWDVDTEYRRKEISNFSGPDDVKYIEYLRLRLEASRDRSEQRINDLKDSRP